MKASIVKYSAFMALGLLLASCSSTKHFMVDVRQPAQVVFPESVVNLAIVDNAGKQIKIDDEDYLALGEEMRRKSSAKDTYVEALTQFMKNENYFGDIVTFPKITRTDAKYGAQYPLTKDEIRHIATDQEVDAVISIDACNINFKTTPMYVDWMSFDGAVSTGDIIARIYDKSGNPLAPAIALSDTVVWLGERDGQGRTADEQLAINLADGTTKILIPYWQSQERWIYSDGTKEMKEGFQYAEVGKWAEAAVSWGLGYEKQKDNNRKGKLAMNIALANENLGDFENASKWTDTALEQFSDNKNSEEYTKTRWYKKMIEQRRRSVQVLSKQFPVSPTSSDTEKE